MSFVEVDDFLAESAALEQIVATLDEAALQRPTQFKQWHIANILGHLAIWNEAARMTYREPQQFVAFMGDAMRALENGTGLRGFEAKRLDTLSGTQIRQRWRDSVVAIGKTYADADPKYRVAWGGPEMSVRSCISARLMETWAHGQAIFDQLGIQREATDRLRHIVMLGVNTFVFNFKVHGLPPPAEMPRLELMAPSGETWLFGDAASDNRIRGSAEAFCQVVTQVRHVNDTDLEVCGDDAAHWMSIAQCFAGPPNPPPAPGSRYRQTG